VVVTEHCHDITLSVCSMHAVCNENGGSVALRYCYSEDGDRSYGILS
jgi:hypothetical protein